MLITEIIESLKSLTLKHGIKISEIERECSIPKNSLASILTGKRTFPLKHKERLQEFCKAKEIALILGSSPTEKLNGKQWVNKISEFCEKKGFPPSELIERFEGLEKRPATIYYVHDITCSANPIEPMGSNGCSCEMYRRAKKAEKQVAELEAEIVNWKSEGPTSGPFKPNTAPKTEKEGKATPKQEKGNERAGNGVESKPKELSPFLKSRQNLKNGIK